MFMSAAAGWMDATLAVGSYPPPTLQQQDKSVAMIPRVSVDVLCKVVKDADFSVTAGSSRGSPVFGSETSVRPTGSVDFDHESDFLPFTVRGDSSCFRRPLSVCELLNAAVIKGIILQS